MKRGGSLKRQVYSNPRYAETASDGDNDDSPNEDADSNTLIASQRDEVSPNNNRSIRKPCSVYTFSYSSSQGRYIGSVVQMASSFWFINLLKVHLAGFTNRLNEMHNLLIIFPKKIIKIILNIFCCYYLLPKATFIFIMLTSYFASFYFFFTRIIILYNLFLYRMKNNLS